MFVNLLQSISCDYPNIRINGYDNNVKYGAMPAKNVRGARTLSFDSKEDESGIHLHIWNDLNNRDNFYPHLMKQIAETSQQKEPSPTPPSPHSSNPNPNHIHINLNEALPEPQPQISPENLLTSTLFQSLGLDEFRKSDQNLYEAFNKLNEERMKQNPSIWNYHPSAKNYIPKAYSLNNAVPGYLIKTVSSFGPQMRPTLHDQMDTGSNVQEYYTNLHKKKPKSIIDAVGYEIGGIPKYSGRLLANEPMPQQYRTFQMFEPVPRQIMLPPPTTRIPEFKPVPPRLKIIPVIDDYLERRPNAIQHPKKLPWTVIKSDEPSNTNYIYPMPVKQVKIIPFKASEAITKAPFRTFIPKTEQNYIEPTTESYYQSQPSLTDSEAFESHKQFINKLKPLKKPTKYPKLIDHFGNEMNQNMNSNGDNTQSPHSYEMNSQFTNKQNQTDSKLQVFYNDEFEYATNMNYNANNIGANTNIKPVSTEEAHSTFNNDIINTTKKRLNKKEKTARKPHRSQDHVMNDVVKLNVTGFHNVSEDENNRIKNHRSSAVRKHKSRLKKDDDDKMQSHNDYPIDSVSADSIQLSQTYSRQTTNVPNSKETPSIRDQDSLLMELANDVKKALLTSMGKENKTIDYQTDEFEEGNHNDPFLITVYDEKYDSQHHDTMRDLNHDSTYDSKLEIDKNLDDVTIEEMRKRDSLSHEARKEGHIQRINKDWASDRKDVIKINVNKRADNIRRKSENKDGIYPSNHKQDNETSNTNNAQYDGTIETNHQNSNTNSTSFDEKYYKWFSKYAEENAKNGRTVISEHFKKVEIEPNISWVILPR